MVQILAPLVGETNVRSQVNLNLDFTQIETTTEDFDNREKGPKTRSEVLAEERGASRDATGIPGALSNRPPANPNPNLALPPARVQPAITSWIERFDMCEMPQVA